MSFHSNAQAPLSATEMVAFRLLPGPDLKTETDPTYGFKELVVKPETK
jgi:hypothetical protein